MNAAVFYGSNNIQIKDIDILKRTNHNSHDYLLKVLSASVCSYDVRTFRNGHFKVKPPIILGHEICAQMVEEKKYNLCINLKEIGSTINGGFAEYLLIPKTIFEIGGVIPVPDNVTNDEASLIEPLACCIN